jgi:SulP family sulfate permease
MDLYYLSMLPQMQRLNVRLPLLKTVKTYQKAWLRRDVIAGVSVTAIAIPQAMACAQLAGVPLTAGLYAALIAMIVFALFSSSRQVILGPDSAVAALAGATILPLAHGNAETAAALVAILSVLIGIACLVGVVARISFIGEFLSRPILLGYMAGLALTVIAFQASKLIGIRSSGTINFISNISYFFNHLSAASLATIYISLIFMAIILILQFNYPRVPASLAVLAIAIIVSTIFHFSNHGIITIGKIPSGLPIPKLTGVRIEDIQSLIVPAVAIMAICYANMITTVRTFADKINDTVDTTQDYIGMGFANMTSGIFGGIPVSTSGTQTTINNASDAKTQVSQLFAALTIIITLVVLAPLLHNLPVCALAVVIIVTISRLFDLGELKSIWHAWRTEALLAVATVIGVVVLGILQGLLLAIFLAVANLIRQSALPYDAVLGVAKNGSIRDVGRPPKTTTIPGLLMYRFDAPLYFANANFFRERVLHLIETADEPIKWFLWDAETITSIDSTAGKMLDKLFSDLRAKHIVFAVARMKGSVREIASRSQHLSKDLEKAPHYSSLGRAIESFKSIQDMPGQKPPKEKLIVSKNELMKAPYSVIKHL